MALLDQPTTKKPRRLGATILADTPVQPSGDTYLDLLQAVANRQQPSISDDDFQLMLDAAGKTRDDFSHDLNALTTLHVNAEMADVVNAAKMHIYAEQAAAQARIAGAIR